MAAYLPPEASGVCRVGPAVCSQTLARNAHVVDFAPGAFNIGTQDEITMLELARLIKDVANSRSELVFRPLPEDDPKQRRPDTTRARTILGWQPRTSMADGLRRTLEYFRTALK